MEELLNQISAKLSMNDRDPIWISVWLSNTGLVRRHHSRYTWTKEEHTRKLNSVLTKLENEGYRVTKNQNFTKKKQYDLHKQYRKTKQRKNRRDKKIRIINEHQNTEVLSRSYTIFCKFDTEPVRENRQHETDYTKKGQIGNGQPTEIQTSTE